MVILHLNNHQVKPIYNQVILPYMHELGCHGIENIYFDGKVLQKKGIDGRFMFKVLSVKLFIEKILKNTLTKFNYNYYNFLERISIISSGLILRKIENTPDIIILYWISGSFNMKTVYKLQQKTGAKVYWYFMDKAPMTGGCHYSWNCKEYQISGCKNCDAFKHEFFSFIAAGNLKYKKKYFDKINITALAPTTESLNLIKKSILFKERDFFLLPIGINKNVFKNVKDNYLDFAHLSRDPGQIYLLVGANNINDVRKGLHLFIKSLEIVKITQPVIFKKLIILAIGHAKVNPFESVGVENILIGYVSSSQLIQLYNFVDIYVCPSIEDLGPLMVNQAAVCGTPILAFNTGVAPDLITNQNSGYLAKLTDVDDLANGLISLVTKDFGADNEQRLENRNDAIQKISIDISVANLINLLQKNQ